MRILENNWNDKAKFLKEFSIFVSSGLQRDVVYLG
jgi:hypothetical protein